MGVAGFWLHCNMHYVLMHRFSADSGLAAWICGTAVVVFAAWGSAFPKDLVT